MDIKISYTFNGVKYKTIESLITSMAENWEKGKKELLSGKVLNYFNKNYTEYNLISTLILEELELENSNQDLLFFKWIYLMMPDLNKVYWKNNSFDDLETCLQDLKKLLDDKKEMSFFNVYQDMLINCVFSTYLMTHLTEDYVIDNIIDLENSCSIIMNNEKWIDVFLNLYFLLAKNKIIIIKGKEFKNVEQLAKHLEKLLKGSFNKLEEFCKEIIGIDGKIVSHIRYWLIGNGYIDIVNSIEM